MPRVKVVSTRAHMIHETKCVQEEARTLDLSTCTAIRSITKNGHAVRSVFATQVIPVGTLLGWYPYSKCVLEDNKEPSAYNLTVHTIDQKQQPVTWMAQLSEKDTQQTLPQICEPSEASDAWNVMFVPVQGTFLMGLVTLTDVAPNDELLLYYGPYFDRVQFGKYSVALRMHYRSTVYSFASIDEYSSVLCWKTRQIHIRVVGTLYDQSRLELQDQWSLAASVVPKHSETNTDLSLSISFSSPSFS